MANYSLTINSKFQPFSLERYLRPYEIYGQAYKEQEAALAALDAQASVWDKLKQSAIDQDVYNQYKAYSDDLKNTADILATEGLSPSIRSAGKQLFARYAAEITPIEEAYKRRQAEADRQAASADRYVYEYDARNKGLRSYMDNTSQVARAIDKVALAQQSAKAYSALAKEMRDIKNPKANYKKLDSFHNILTNQYGYSSEEAAKFMDAVRNGEISTSDAALSAVYNSLYNSTGVGSWDNQAAKNEVSNTILDGVSQAVGTTQRQVVTNEAAVIAAKKRAAKEVVDYQNAKRIKMNDPNTTTFYSPDEVAKMNKEKADKIKYYRSMGYIAADGKVTRKGTLALTEVNKKSGLLSGLTTKYISDKKTKEARKAEHWANPEWRTFYQNAMNNPFAKMKDGRKSFSNYIRNVETAIKNGELATGTANFDVQRLSIKEQAAKDNLADKIFAAIGEDGYVYMPGQLKNGTIQKGRKISAKELKKMIGRDSSGKGNSNILHVVNSLATNENPSRGLYGQQFIELADGTKFILPRGVMSNENRMEASNAAYFLQNAGSEAEKATNLNRGNAAVASVFTNVKGADVQMNDGTYTYILDDIME